jgi:hypothetical protein
MSLAFQEDLLDRFPNGYFEIVSGWPVGLRNKGIGSQSIELQRQPVVVKFAAYLT